jgi:ABC-type Fe3+ transport system permease subunit
MDDKPKFDISGYLSFIIALIPITVAIFDRGGPGKYGVFSDIMGILILAMPFLAITFGIGGLVRFFKNAGKKNCLLISGMVFSILGIIGGTVLIIIFLYLCVALSSFH